MHRGGFFFCAALLLLQTGFSFNNRPLLQEPDPATETPTLAETPVPPPDTPTAPPTETATESPSAEPQPTDTPVASETAGQTPVPSETPTVTATEPPAQTVLISEVAWAGTAASTADEWIELWNPGPAPVDLAGWVLTDGGDIRVALSGGLPPGSFYLLERTDDSTVRDVAADMIYSGALSNAGESIYLYNPQNGLADSANSDGGPWPAGRASFFGTMERTGTGPATDSSWCTNDGLHRSGADASGNPINGTPRAPWSGDCGSGNPPSTPTATSTLLTFTPSSSSTTTLTPEAPLRAVVISEVAWAGTEASSADEWIELWNSGPAPVDLAGWMLTDGGDIRAPLGGILDGGGYLLLERTGDDVILDVAADQIYTGSLANGGETLRLLDPSGRVIDAANPDGGSWPGGAAAPLPASMERAAADSDSDSAWCTNDGIHRAGLDALGNPVHGTPRAAFSGFCAQPSPTRTPTPTPTPTIVPTPFPDKSVVINEIAWAGTETDGNDEWMELFNPGMESILLDGWFLTDDGDVHIRLQGSIPPGGFFILERGGDDTLSDIPADQLYTGNLANSGEQLRLIDPSGRVVDSAGQEGSPWPAGRSSPPASMERSGIELPVWADNNGWRMNGRDAQNHPVRGTPGQANSLLFPVPTPTPLPKGVLINEFLPKPGSDWNGDGLVDVNDEFVELYNAGSAAVDLAGWVLDDIRSRGSRPYKIPGGVAIPPKGYAVFFHRQTRLSLNDGGDEIWLYAPDGTRVDGTVYTKTRWPDSAWNRFPDGWSVLRLGFPPTPGEKNRLPPDLFSPASPPRLKPLAGWREVECAVEDAPLLLGDGFLTTGHEDSLLAAEGFGWFASEGGECFAWAQPRNYGGPASTGRTRTSAGDFAFGWWWEAWFIR